MCGTASGRGVATDVQLFSDQGLAVITITPPFADPFDKDVFSTLSFHTLPAPPGFSPIGQPGSLRAISDAGYMVSGFVVDGTAGVAI